MSPEPSPSWARRRFFCLRIRWLTLAQRVFNQPNLRRCTSRCACSAPGKFWERRRPFRKLVPSKWRPGPAKGTIYRRDLPPAQGAEVWALDMERRIDQGEVPNSRTRKKPTTFGDLIDLHLAALQQVGRAPRRSKAFTLDALKAKLGGVRMADLNRKRLIRFGKDRLKEGAGPVTVGMNLSYIKTIITHAAAVHGLPVSPEAVDLARTALKHLGVVGRSRSRDRRPTETITSSRTRALGGHCVPARLPLLDRPDNRVRGRRQQRWQILRRAQLMDRFKSRVEFELAPFRI